MEFCAGSSLCDIMEATRRCYTEQQIAAVMAGTLEGLIYLHRLNKIHRDVKAGNLLLSESGIIKLADFGVAAQMASTMSRRGTVIGTPFWMAPEVISGGPEGGYNAKADVWSLGITAIELAEGAPPHSDMHPMRAIFLIPTLPPPTLAEAAGWSEHLVDFVRRCVVKDIEERPFSSELLSHPLIAEGRVAQQRGVLLSLMGSSREPLRVWRLQNDREEDEKKGKLGSGALAAGSGAFATSSVKQGDTQEFDVEAIRGVAKAIAAGSVVGTMVVHSDDKGDGDDCQAYGTMVVNNSDTAGPGCCGGGASMVINHAAALPAFLRQFKPAPASVSERLNAAISHAEAPAPLPQSSEWSSCSSCNDSVTATASGYVPPPENTKGSIPVHRVRQNTSSHHSHTDKGNKYDFSHLNLAEIDEELACIGANLERDMGKLKRQYEKRERALRAARTTKMGAACA